MKGFKDLRIYIMKDNIKNLCLREERKACVSLTLKSQVAWASLLSRYHGDLCHKDPEHTSITTCYLNLALAVVWSMYIPHAINGCGSYWNILRRCQVAMTSCDPSMCGITASSAKKLHLLNASCTRRMFRALVPLVPVKHHENLMLLDIFVKKRLDILARPTLIIAGFLVHDSLTKVLPKVQNMRTAPLFSE